MATNPPAAADVDSKTYIFLVSWLVMIGMLTLVNRTRLGHVIIYYSLLLLILIIIAAEYQQISPFLQLPTISDLNATAGGGAGGKF